MHYHFDSEDETLKAWTLGLGSHPLSWEEIQKTATNNNELECAGFGVNARR